MPPELLAAIGFSAPAARIKGSGNVFLDLGFDPAEAKIMALRAEVMIRMEQHLKAQGWTQAEAARRLGITQPRVSRLIKGRWQDFSLDMLLTLAARRTRTETATDRLTEKAIVEVAAHLRQYPDVGTGQGGTRTRDLGIMRS
jgi:predicted XRE-type DNA-binding protein